MFLVIIGTFPCTVTANGDFVLLKTGTANAKSVIVPYLNLSVGFSFRPNSNTIFAGIIALFGFVLPIMQNSQSDI